MTAEVLEGVVRRVVFRADGGEFSVLRVLSERGNEVSVRGPLPSVVAGESIRLVGEWREDQRFGRQFCAEAATVSGPVDENALVVVLSEITDGVGVGLASRAVRAAGGPDGLVKFLDGLSTDVIDWSLFPSDGARRQMTEALGRMRAAWTARRAESEIDLGLAELGLTPSQRRALSARYGGSAVSVCRLDPYRLCEEVEGFGFVRADELARKVGVAVDSVERRTAALRHAMLDGAARDGHVYASREEARRRVEALTGITCEDESLRAASEYLRLTGFAEVNQAGAVAVARLAACERRIADVAGASRELEGALLPLGGQATLMLSEQQWQACKLVVSRSFSIMTGGPGTGKTTTTRAVCDEMDRARTRYLLCAPTGRAARRLAEATGRPAQTIHRLLEYSPADGGFTRNAQNPLEADVVVADEASMIDVELMDSLLLACGRGTRVVLVGDADQLSPVGPGAPFRDLCRAEGLPVARLTEVHRQAAGSRVIAASRDINAGRMFEASPAGDRSDGCLFVVEEPDQERLVERVVRMASVYIPEKFGVAAADVQIVAPQRRGTIGVEALNAAMQAATNKSIDKISIKRGEREVEFRGGDRIMQTRNDYARGVVNGEIGVVAEVRPLESGKREAGAVLLVAEFDGRRVEYRRADLHDLDLAYASTVHRVQGSEFSAVIVVCHHAHSFMLDRSLLYTAVTRAKRVCVVVGTRRGIQGAVRKASSDERRTTLPGAIRRILCDNKTAT